MRLPRFSFFVIPPGVPYSDGSRAHSEDGSTNARSHILWLQALPEGLSVHTCRTEGEEHLRSPGVFVANSRLRPLAEMLIAALQKEAAQHLANSLLLSLTMWFMHDLEASPQGNAVVASPVGNHENRIGVRHRSGAPTLDAPVQRACDYIHNYLSHPLTVESIARHAFVSAPHLNRLFRADLGCSVMRYVTQRRIGAARSLLHETEYGIREISEHLGYAHLSHFSRVFARETGTTPSTFRKQPTKKIEICKS